MPEIMEAQPDVFDLDGLFDDLAMDLEAIDLAETAQAALSGILTIQTDDGETRTWEQIRTESEAFFANPIVANSMELLGAAAAQYAAFCNHNHGAAEELTGGSLSDIYDLGNAKHDDHAHSNVHESKGKNEKETKKKKKQARKASWWMLFLSKKEA